MLNKEVFKFNFIGANAIKGYSVSANELRFIYGLINEDFEDEEFAKITKIVCKECKTYGKILDIQNWYEKKKQVEVEWEENLQMYLDNLAEEPKNKIKQKLVDDFCLKHPEREDVKQYIERCKFLEEITGIKSIPEQKQIEYTPTKEECSNFLKMLKDRKK